MSGFLQRLALQAIGSANALRPVARSPYTAPPPTVNAEELDGQITALVTVGNERLHGANSGAQLKPMPGQEQHQASLHTETETQASENQAEPSSENAMQQQPHSGANKLAAEKPPVLVEAAHFTLKDPAKQQPHSDEKKTGAGEPPAWAGEIETQTRVIDSSNGSIADDKQYSTLPHGAFPQPLLPLNNSARPLTSSAGATAQRGKFAGSTQQNQIEETTEVHVNIGRIEVTAVHEAPPPKRQAPAAAKPMTLDEYLARRKREA